MVTVRSSDQGKNPGQALPDKNMHTTQVLPGHSSLGNECETRCCNEVLIFLCFLFPN